MPQSLIYSLVVVCAFIYVTNCTPGPLCYSCTEEIKPSSCAKVERCGVHEVCALERGQNLMGETIFWSGCKDKMSCSGRKRNSSPAHVSVDCAVCCDGDFCNQHGCGEQVYHQHQNEGPLCLHCNSINNPDACSFVRRCRGGELCSIEATLLNGQTTYRQSCTNSSSCAALYNAGKCSRCCKTDFCNRECSDKIKTTTPSQSTTKIPTTTLEPTVWASINPQGINRLKCYTCQNVRSIGPECMEKFCNANEKCYIDQGIGVGDVFSLGCRREEFCSGISFGKRQSIYRAECCSSDNCNLKIYQSYTSRTNVSSTSKSPLTKHSYLGSTPVITGIDAGTGALTLGKTVTISCTASGNPVPKVYWAVPVFKGHPMQNYREELTGQLDILNIQHKNEGYYSCIAENKYGRTVKGVYITVV